MNVERMEALAKYLDKLPEEKFDMDFWVWSPLEDSMCEADALNSCGTTCCIAGWAVLMSGECLDPFTRTVDRDGHKKAIRDYAYDYLDLSSFQASLLFHKHMWPDEFRTQLESPKLAAKVIRRMIEEGR